METFVFIDRKCDDMSILSSILSSLSEYGWGHLGGDVQRPETQQTM